MIEMPTFQQILEMDDDEEERDFSKSIVYDFFEQAESTFEKMEAALYVIPPIHVSLFSETLPSLCIWVDKGGSSISTKLFVVRAQTVSNF